MVSISPARANSLRPRKPWKNSGIIWGWILWPICPSKACWRPREWKTRTRISAKPVLTETTRFPLTPNSPSNVWDSMQKQTVAFSRDSSNLFFHILTKCNLSCSHCYINKDQHGADTLDIATIEAWLDLFATKASSTNLIFLGGEPTLHPDLALAVKTAKRLGFKSITIDTNGYLFHDILDKISSDDIDFLSFSLDGATPGTNDTVRGQGSYKKVLEGIEKAVGKGFSCSMIY